VTAEQRVQKIRDRLARITPGRWEARPHTDGYELLSDQTSEWVLFGTIDGNLRDGRGYDNLRLIANAPADIAFLLAEIDRLNALLPKPLLLEY